MGPRYCSVCSVRWVALGLWFPNYLPQSPAQLSIRSQVSTSSVGKISVESQGAGCGHLPSNVVWIPKRLWEGREHSQEQPDLVVHNLLRPFLCHHYNPTESHGWVSSCASAGSWVSSEPRDLSGFYPRSSCHCVFSASLWTSLLSPQVWLTAGWLSC